MIVSQREKIPAFLQNLEYRNNTYRVQNVKGLLFTDIETKNDLITIPIERLNVVERSIDETEEQMICVENNIDTTECNKDFVAWIASPRECYCILDEK
jgi:low affinity Fe/Cu permease